MLIGLSKSTIYTRLIEKSFAGSDSNVQVLFGSKREVSFTEFVLKRAIRPPKVGFYIVQPWTRAVPPRVPG
jgi:hypothetical protein